MLARRHNEHALVRKRMEVVFLGFLAGVLILALRLTYLQWVQGRRFQELADRMQIRTVVIDAARGRILDRNGALLATDVLGKAICINPRLVRDADATVNRLAAMLGLAERDREAMRQRLTRAMERRSFYAQLRRGVDRRLAERILEQSRTDPALRGLWLEDSPVRVNPCGRDGIQLLGSVNVDRRGIEGFELLFDPILRGRDGERRVRVSATGEPIPESELRVVEPEDGRDVRLTIDRDIQHFVETELEKMAQEQQPDAATAIVLDVRQGHVLAMASWPTFRPGDRGVRPEQRRNRAITDLFEPGSIFKVFTAAAALEYGVPTHVYCGGSRSVGSRTIRCAHGASHGAVDLKKMIEQSCNVAAGTLAERIGAKRLYHFLDRFGFQQKTGIEFPGEEYGRFLPPDEWRAIRTVNVGFGQGVVATPIQLLAGYAAIANDGLYVPPRLVLDAPGFPLPVRQPRRVLSPAHAATLREYMESVVTSGTGKAAKIPGYSVAGKTGTAQIARHGRYGYGYVASFVGFLPVRQPRLAILVSVWHPRRGQYGGVVAAPVFREIARQSVAYLRIPPDAVDDLRDGGEPASFARHARRVGSVEGRVND